MLSAGRLKSQPLPLTITEYKNHPLYALKRHLLKFEGDNIAFLVQRKTLNPFSLPSSHFSFSPPFDFQFLIKFEDDNITFLVCRKTLHSPLIHLSLPFNSPGLYVLNFFLPPLPPPALYPEDSPVVGHCKGEAVYARSNVHMVSACLYAYASLNLPKIFKACSNFNIILRLVTSLWLKWKLLIFNFGA